MMHGVSQAQASEACERVRAAIEAHPWSALQTGIRVTASIGLALADGDSEMGDLLKTADARLYSAKRSGRNRVVDA